MNDQLKSDKLETVYHYSDRKNKIFNKFYFLSTPEMRETLNEIISDFRNIPLSDAKRKHCVRPNEYKEFIKRMGLAD